MPQKRRVILGEADLELFKLLRILRLATIEELGLLLRDYWTLGALKRRLSALFHSFHITRPLSQQDRRHRKRGRPPDVYSLGNAGAAALRKAGVAIPHTDFNQRARELTLGALEHTLLTARVLAAFLAGLHRTPGLRLHRVLPDGEFRTHVTVTHRQEEIPLTVKPDAVLVVEELSTQSTLALLLEIDRGTEPKERTGLDGSAFFRKALGYTACWHETDRLLPDLHSQDFLVLTVTKTARRAEGLRDVARAASREPDIADLFWFTTTEPISLHNPERILFNPIWKTAAGVTGSLF